jgi:hypothetical protein
LPDVKPSSVERWRWSPEGPSARRLRSCPAPRERAPRPEPLRQERQRPPRRDPAAAGGRQTPHSPARRAGAARPWASRRPRSAKCRIQHPRPSCIRPAPDRCRAERSAPTGAWSKLPPNLSPIRSHLWRSPYAFLTEAPSHSGALPSLQRNAFMAALCLQQGLKGASAPATWLLSLCHQRFANRPAYCPGPGSASPLPKVVALAHVPEKWTPVFRQGHAQNEKLEPIPIPSNRDGL